MHSPPLLDVELGPELRGRAAISNAVFRERGYLNVTELDLDGKGWRNAISF